MSQKEEKKKLISDFRHGIIGELCNSNLTPEKRMRMIKEKASVEYEIPFSDRTSVTVSCIKNWLKLYRKKGNKGLVPKIRDDWKSCRALTENEQSKLLCYLEEHVDVPATQAVKTLQRKGDICSSISQSSLSRFVIASGMDRENRKNAQDQERNLKFDFFNPLECVQVDVVHTFKVPDDKGKMRKALLISFIDDATRYLLYSNFSFTEESLEFEKGICNILKRHGRIIKLYVDNGSTFISGQTERIMNILNIHLIHSRPAKPKGRGKIERFFRTVRDQFLRPLDKDSVTGLDDLNMRFREWREGEYHLNPHRGLNGATPRDVWLKKTDSIISMSPTINIDDVFRHEISRKVYKDNTIRLNNVLYETPGLLAGKTVKVKYNPHVAKLKLQIYYNGKYEGEALVVDSYANTRVKRNWDNEKNRNEKKNKNKRESSLLPDAIKPKSPLIASLSASKLTVE